MLKNYLFILIYFRAKTKNVCRTLSQGQVLFAIDDKAITDCAFEHISILKAHSMTKLFHYIQHEWIVVRELWLKTATEHWPEIDPSNTPRFRVNLQTCFLFSHFWLCYLLHWTISVIMTLLFVASNTNPHFSMPNQLTH